MINVTNHPLISIVIPVYNGEKTLVETLKSVLNQMYSHFEIIIVDNGSDQPVETLIQSFLEDKRIRVLRTNGKKFIPYFRKERYGTRNVLIINCIYRFVIHRTISGSGLIN
ncbi:glycosyltransferase family 2 protein [Proteiniphilum acetatigenes]|uniref:glycosyltransferase family 2 protein n=1 Tax=Proteiniphilum acetatigenes TaxID=294710 RepID=UPI00036BDDFF|nr:Glycosyl transferase family 2 [Porphyromonadaceae bacterium KH3CP3RA]